MPPRERLDKSFDEADGAPVFDSVMDDYARSLSDERLDELLRWGDLGPRTFRAVKREWLRRRRGGERVA